MKSKMIMMRHHVGVISNVLAFIVSVLADLFNKYFLNFKLRLQLKHNCTFSRNMLEYTHRKVVKTSVITQNVF